MVTPSPEAIDLEIRRIASELETFPYVSKTFTEDPKHRGNAGHYNIVAGCGGAAVYHDIIAEGGHGTRRAVKYVADLVLTKAALRTRCERETAKAIEYVAFLRLTGATAISHAELPPDAGLYYTPSRFAGRGRPVPAVLSGAGKIGANVARYLRAHARKPYVRDSTIEWMVEHARLAWREAMKETEAA